MIGTLACPIGTHLRSLSFAGTSRSGGKLSCKAATAAPPAMDTRRSSGSLYDVLRVKRNASPTEIKTAYRSLAKMYHPDTLEESDGRDFIEIHNAYATLSDPAARAIYDLSLVSAGSGRRTFGYSTAAAAGGGRPGFYPTRRWETDQCW